MFGKTKFYLFYISLNWASLQGCTLNSDPSGCSLPARICQVTGLLKSRTAASNRMLLYGPPGNGKSKLAEIISKEVDADLIVINTPLLVDEFSGSAAQAVARYFQDAEEKFLRTGRPQHLFFDEVDAIADATSLKGREFNKQKIDALKALNLHLDRHHPSRYSDPDYAYKHGLMFTFATNEYGSLDSAFLSRAGIKIEIKNPDAVRTKCMATHFLKAYRTFEKLEPKHVDLLAKKMDGLSVRAQEDAIQRGTDKSNYTGSTEYKHYEDAVAEIRREDAAKAKAESDASSEGWFNRAVQWTGLTGGLVTIGSAILDVIKGKWPTKVERVDYKGGPMAGLFIGSKK